MAHKKRQKKKNSKHKMELITAIIVLISAILDIIKNLIEIVKAILQ